MDAAIPERDVRRDQFGWFVSIPLRFNDLDAYRHVNNARYYTFLDTAIMAYLQTAGGFDLVHGPVVPFTVENGCRFHAAFAYPEVVEAGLMVTRLGRSSVRYGIGLFAADEPHPRVTGYFVDVFVDQATAAPVEIPKDIRAHLARIVHLPDNT